MNQIQTSLIHEMTGDRYLPRLLCVWLQVLSWETNKSHSSGIWSEKGKRKLRKHLKGDRTTLKNFKPFNVILMFTIKSFRWIGSGLEAF